MLICTPLTQLFLELFLPFVCTSSFYGSGIQNFGVLILVSSLKLTFTFKTSATLWGAFHGRGRKYFISEATRNGQDMFQVGHKDIAFFLHPSIALLKALRFYLLRQTISVTINKWFSLKKDIISHHWAWLRCWHVSAS